MGVCTLCGDSCGWLLSRHDECLRRRDAAKTHLLRVATQVAAGVEPTFEAAVTAAVAAARHDRGNHPVAHPDRLDSYVRRLAFDRFLGDARAAANREFVSDAELLQLLSQAATEATTLIFNDHLMTEIEGERIMSFFSAFGALGIDNVSFGAEFITHVSQATLIRSINEGCIPDDRPLPYFFTLNLQKSESFIESLTCLGFYEETLGSRHETGAADQRVVTSQDGYLGPGAFQSEPGMVTELEYMDSGRLILTTRHIYFEGRQRTHRIAYGDVAKFRPFTDGVGIQRAAYDAKPEVYRVEDVWYAFNLIKALSAAAD